MPENMSPSNIQQHQLKQPQLNHKRSLRVLHKPQVLNIPSIQPNSRLHFMPHGYGHRMAWNPQFCWQLRSANIARQVTLLHLQMDRRWPPKRGPTCQIFGDWLYIDIFHICTFKSYHLSRFVTTSKRCGLLESSSRFYRCVRNHEKVMSLIDTQHPGLSSWGPRFP